MWTVMQNPPVLLESQMYRFFVHAFRLFQDLYGAVFSK